MRLAAPTTNRGARGSQFDATHDGLAGSSDMATGSPNKKSTGLDKNSM